MQPEASIATLFAVAFINALVSVVQETFQGISMSGNTIDGEALSGIQPMPRSALQALYHAVTGKTENLSKRLKGNVVIRYSDFEQLYLRIKQQAEHYDILAQPTVTIVVKQESSRSIQYSSWERFKEFQQNANEITSEISLKMEFVTQIPNTPSPQRFVINVGLDSGLPVISNEISKDIDGEFAAFFIFISKDYPTAEISIDFVDFLIAKIFSALVEEWFSGLERIKTSRVMTYMLSRLGLVHSIINQFARIGVSVFIASYALFGGHHSPSVTNIAYAISLCILLWSILAVMVSYTNSSVTKKLSRGAIPSIILLTSGDDRAYQNVLKNKTSVRHTMLNIIAASLTTVVLNVLSSYIYTALTNTQKP